MATVTVTFRDDFQGEEGVQVELKSDPALIEDRSTWTEAQHMAMGLLHMLDQTIKAQQHAESHGACPVTGMKAQAEEPKSCDGQGGCGGGGHCSRHEHTDPEDCCKNH